MLITIIQRFDSGYDNRLKPDSCSHLTLASPTLGWEIAFLVSRGGCKALNQLLISQSYLIQTHYAGWAVLVKGIS